jgi:hypothetical protein
MTNLMPDIATASESAAYARQEEMRAYFGSRMEHWRRSATEAGAEGGVPFGCGDYTNPLGRYLSLMLARIMHPKSERWD